MNESQSQSVPATGDVKKVVFPGAEFGRWTVKRFDHKRGKAKYWLCRCSCGNEKVIGETTFRYGGSTSCGCRRNEVVAARSTTHGKSKGSGPSPEYITWANMIQRCTNPKHPRFNDYGGRGITVCDRWLTFENFYEDMGQRPQGLTLDRYPNINGNYEKSNCRWGTDLEQGEGKRNNAMLTYKGETLSRPAMARKYNVSRGLLKGRVQRGWSVEDAIETPVKFNSRWHSHERAMDGL